MDSTPRRRWFRYSLRTLLVFVTVACAGFGWLGLKMRQAQRQEELAKAIDELGGGVVYDYEIDSNGDWVKSPTPPGPVWLRNMLGDKLFASIAVVDLVGARITDADLVQLQELRRLKAVGLHYTQNTDAGLIHLQGFTKLERLDLTETRITDKGCQELQKMFPKLQIRRR